MPSLLTTRKMDPELRARVQASVEGRRRAPGTKLAPRIMSLIRIGTFGGMIGLLIWLGLFVRRTHRELESDRSALLDRVRREAAQLSPDEKAATSRILPWLAQFSGAYEGDLVAEELRSNGAFASVLATPTLPAPPKTRSSYA